MKYFSSGFHYHVDISLTRIILSCLGHATNFVELRSKVKIAVLLPWVVETTWEIRVSFGGAPLESCCPLANLMKLHVNSRWQVAHQSFSNITLEVLHADLYMLFSNFNQPILFCYSINMSSVDMLDSHLYIQGYYRRE